MPPVSFAVRESISQFASKTENRMGFTEWYSFAL